MSVADPISLSPKEAAEYIGLSKPSIYRLLSAGILKGKRAGARTLIDGVSVRAYYKSLPDYAAGHAIPNAPQSLAQNRKRLYQGRRRA